MRRVGIALVLAALVVGVAAASSSSFWEMSSFTDFIAGKDGRVALGREWTSDACAAAGILC